MVRIFSYEVHPQTENYIMLQHVFALANVIGIVALVWFRADVDVKQLVPAVAWRFGLEVPAT